MCGFAGFILTKPQAFAWQDVLRRMGNAITHRGPDAEDSWFDTSHGVGFVFRRLAIQDLSPAAMQPMCSNDQRYVLVFNGEIYNFNALRDALQPLNIQWRSHSDTEVLLNCLIHWGLEATLAKVNGMFAFALWDRDAKTVILARDRFGIKPLYYGWIKDTFLFGSELRALEQFPEFDANLDHGAIEQFLGLSYVPAPQSVYEEIKKLPAGHYVQLNVVENVKDKKPKNIQYYHHARLTTQTREMCSLQEATMNIKSCLAQSVKQRMIADVPLGAFLSGGIDSTLITALMAAQSMQPINTFSIGFHHALFDEAPYAKAIAAHLGTNHTEVYLHEQDALSIVPDLPSIYDEPFADSSQIPTFLVSKVAREKVTVSLSGDGGDELFGGYNRYFLANRLWKALSGVPRVVRLAVYYLLKPVPLSLWGIVLSKTQFKKFIPKIAKAFPMMVAQSERDVYEHLIYADVSRQKQKMEYAWQQATTFSEQMMFADLMTYLPHDILTKVDRASMAVSLECRVPFLDHHVVEQAWRLPVNMKISDGKGKLVLRELLKQFVPDNLMERPKQGFAIPLANWLRGPLKEWAGDMLHANALYDEGILNQGMVQRLWREHQLGKRQHHTLLWNIIMLQAWYLQRCKTGLLGGRLGCHSADMTATTKKKKLLYITNDARYFLTHRLSLALYAAQHGFEIYVAVPNDKHVAKIKSYGFHFLPIQCRRKGMNPFLELLNLYSILRVYRKIKPELIHLVAIKSVVYGGILARLFTKAYVVNTISGLGYVYTREQSQGKLLRHFVNTLYRFSLGNKRSKTVFQNQDDRKLFLESKNIKAERCSIIRGSGVDIQHFKAIPLPDNKLTIALVSRLLWTKGIQEYVDAAKLVKQHYPMARVLLIGDIDHGNPAAIPATTVQAWHDAGVIEWSGGWCDDVRTVFAEVALVCLPSYREGLPKVLLEAAACARPLITTDVPGCREVVRPMYNGLLVLAYDANSLADAILQLFDQPEQLAQMAQNSRYLIEQELSADKVNQAYGKIYEY